MSIQGAPILKNLLGKENNKKTIFDKLSQSVKITGKTTGNSVDAAGSNVQKMDGFSIQSELMEYLDPTAGLSEEEKKAYEEKIMQKLRSGKKLTAEEMNYLRAKNPQLYVQAARVQAMRENLKKQLENCKSKEEVEKVYGNFTSMISKDDPMKEALVAAYDDELKEFKKTDKYQALPEKEEKAPGKFEDVMLIRNDKDLQEFCAQYGVVESEIKKEW